HAVISVIPKVSRIRPYITGVIARGGKMNGKLLSELISMQEDLHFGICRRRKKSSIGIHDLAGVTFPLKYTTAKRSHRFVPLNSDNSLDVSQILSDTDVGRNYGDMLKGFEDVPILLDANGDTISFPPIINASSTTVTTSTRDIFVEVTGINRDGIENVLSVISITLQSAGFTLESVNVSGAKNATPKLAPRIIPLNHTLVAESLGLNMTPREIVTSLRKSRLDATVNGDVIKCVIPPYRFDIFGAMDLVEEVALGYGIENITPQLLPPQVLGNFDASSEVLRELEILMVGLGYTEALNSTLTSNDVYNSMLGGKKVKPISVLDSKSAEHTLLRNFILPGLVENLSRNIHAQYPQKLFETGTVFHGVAEEINLACISAHKNAGFTEIKSVLCSLLETGFGIDIQTRATKNPMFEDGRTAAILAGKQKVGVIGEINSAVLTGKRIRVPVSGFELSLSGLIFD
ncbi:MAG: phenylalanine--tRNA ligase subunit beta, partial [Thaumarchaeota archaeon]|nr:phenylalanine--tRNA ligase subunit beta [Nitrososphaerota archaeon]